MPLLTRDLITAYLGNAAGQFTTAQLDRAAADLNDGIPRYCRRTFDQATYKVWADSDGGYLLYTCEYPVSAVYRAYAGASAALRATYTASTEARVTVTPSSLYLITPAAAVTALTLSTYADMAALAAAIAGTSGWAAEVLTEGNPPDLRPVAAINSPASISLPSSPVSVLVAGDNSISRADGGRWTSGARAVFLHYQAGYSSIPADLVRVSLEVARDLLYSLLRDPSVVSERNDTASWTAPEVNALLRRHHANLYPWINHARK